MKLFFNWLLGERASLTLTAVWNWLWGIPVESGGKVAVEVAQISLHAMQESVQQLADSVAKIKASHQKARAMYEDKQKELKRAEEQAQLAHRNRNVEAARLAMGRVIALERLLPQLAEKITESETILHANQERLSREWQHLETYKFELQNLKDISVVSEALATIATVNRDITSDSAQSQFKQAQSAVEERYLQKTAFAELSENPLQKATAELDTLTLDSEITRRLTSLDKVSDH